MMEQKNKTAPEINFEEAPIYDKEQIKNKKQLADQSIKQFLE